MTSISTCSLVSFAVPVPPCSSQASPLPRRAGRRTGKQ